MQRKAVPTSSSEWKVLITNKTLPTTTLIEHLLLGEDEVGPHPRPQEAKAEATAEQLHNSADDHREVGALQSTGNDGTNTYASEQAENGTSKEDVDDDADQTHGIVLNDGDMEEGVQTHFSDKETVGGVHNKCPAAADCFTRFRQSFHFGQSRCLTFIKQGADHSVTD